MYRIVSYMPGKKIGKYLQNSIISFTFSPGFEFRTRELRALLHFFPKTLSIRPRLVGPCCLVSVRRIRVRDPPHRAVSALHARGRVATILQSSLSSCGQRPQSPDTTK